MQCDKHICAGTYVSNVKCMDAGLSDGTYLIALNTYEVYILT